MSLRCLAYLRINLYDAIIDIISDYINHHSDELFDSEFNSESNIWLQNKIITDEIFGDNGIYAILLNNTYSDNA